MTLSATHTLWLKQLPDLVWDSIFGNLQKRDLLKVCYVSKDLLRLASGRLFKNIIVTDDHLAAAFACDQMRMSTSTYYTVIKSAQIINLLRVISRNEELAVKIKVIHIYKSKDLKHIPELLAHTKLKSYFLTSPMSITLKVLQTLHSMCCYVDSAFVTAPNLTDLKIVYSENEVSRLRFKDLARHVIRQRSYLNLRRLLFEHTKGNPDQLGPFCSDSNYAAFRAVWLAFFKTLSEENVSLNLTSISLDGNLMDEGKATAQIIRLVINTDVLHTLELKHSEICHPEQNHTPQQTFLKCLTMTLPLLQYLSMNPTGNCRMCQVNEILYVFQENVPNQLKELRIMFAPACNADANAIQCSILSHQRILEKLEYNDALASWYDTKAMLKSLNITQFTKWFKFSFDRSGVFPPQILSRKTIEPYMCESKVDLMKQCMGTFSEFLHRDPIFLKAAKSLPFLTEYCILGIHVNVKKRGVQVNGEILPLVV